MYPCFTIFRVQLGVWQASISSTTKKTVLGPCWPDAWGDRGSPRESVIGRLFDHHPCRLQNRIRNQSNYRGRRDQ
jgi:hypothetical protein